MRPSLSVPELLKETQTMLQNLASMEISLKSVIGSYAVIKHLLNIHCRNTVGLYSVFDICNNRTMSLYLYCILLGYIKM